MSITLRIKKMAEKVPPQFGYLLKGMPYDRRLGKRYNFFREQFESFDALNVQQQKDTLFQQVHKRTREAYDQIPFYRDFLYGQGIHPNDLKTFEDLQKLPLITKKILKTVELPQRSYIHNTLGLFNTGGTSGNPLGFYLDADHYCREWAFMHQMWNRVGYSPDQMKLTVRGKNVGDRLYKYNLSQNEFILDAYRNYTREDFESLSRMIRRYGIKFLHGYPSSIYMLLKQAEAYPFFGALLKERIKGIIFCSEFPVPAYRDYIESIVTENTLSFYGHTEGCVMAGELYRKFEFVPYHAYGYTEAVADGDTYHLVSTSQYNQCAPFIRYDTEDLIEPVFADGLLQSFQIKQGRTSDFIEDRNGAAISLTSFFFGRHHPVYHHADYLQVEQVGKGKIIIYLVAKKPIPDPKVYFDLGNFFFDIEFKMIDVPFRTPAGKVPFLIRKQA
jgi:phenylacetate-CoA ligase